MSIDEVLLTQKEVNDACEKFQQEHSQECTDYDCCSKCPVLPKAAQLKLLEWLKEECKEHYHMQPSYRKSHTRKMACPKCMSELESKLKEVGK
jgi:hypothetical protein